MAGRAGSLIDECDIRVPTSALLNKPCAIRSVHEIEVGGTSNARRAAPKEQRGQAQQTSGEAHQLPHIARVDGAAVCPRKERGRGPVGCGDNKPACSDQASEGCISTQWVRGLARKRHAHDPHGYWSPRLGGVFSGLDPNNTYEAENALMHHLPKDNEFGAQSEVPSARVERSPLRVAEFAAAKQQIVANNQNSPVEDACRRTSVKCGAGGYSKVPEGAKMRAPESETQLTRTMPVHGAEAFE